MVCTIATNGASPDYPPPDNRLSDSCRGQERLRVTGLKSRRDDLVSGSSHELWIGQTAVPRTGRRIAVRTEAVKN